MWRWASCSDGERRDPSWRRRGAVPLAACLVVLCPLAASPAPAVVLLTQEEALGEVFSGAEVERQTEFLSEEQVAEIQERAGSELGSRIVIRYRGTREGQLVGTAYFDAHLVRTLPETIMVLLGREGSVQRVEVLSFEEPRDYLPRARWFEQFHGKLLDDDLALNRSIRGVTGATLSSRAVTQAVRRILATHRVLEAAARAAEGEPAGEGP